MSLPVIAATITVSIAGSLVATRGGLAPADGALDARSPTAASTWPFHLEVNASLVSPDTTRRGACREVRRRHGGAARRTSPRHGAERPSAIHRPGGPRYQIDTTVDLLFAERRGIDTDYCPTCRGVWLDVGELDKLIAHQEDERPQGRGDDRYERRDDRL